MGLYVAFESTTPRKFLTTVSTLERLLTSVGPNVPLEITLIGKFPITVITLERFFTSVAPHVYNEMTLIIVEKISDHTAYTGKASHQCVSARGY